MNPRVMDAVGLISRFVTDHWESLFDSAEVQDELSSQGFSKREITNAFKWIEANTLGEGVDVKSDSPISISPPLRIFSSVEQGKLTPKALGLLMKCYERGLLDPLLLEEVMERIMRSESHEVDEREVRRMTALALFSRVQDEWKEYLLATNTLLH